MRRIKEVIQFIRTRTFVFHLALALSIIVVILSTIYLGLGSYTNHGETITVPNFKGLDPKKLNEFISDKNLKYKIVDSVYNPRLAQGTVIDQEPKPEYKVKEGRTIYLTINSQIPPQIKMPNLVDVSDRQAEAILQTYGLRMGQKIFRPDLAKNAVLDQLVGGTPIKPGTPIHKGSVIDLVLGDGLGNQKVSVPNLLGRTREEALFVLKGLSLNSYLQYDPDIKDTAEAKVYKQTPEPASGNTLNQGESIDLYFTQNPDKLKVLETPSADDK